MGASNSRHRYHGAVIARQAHEQAYGKPDQRSSPDKRSHTRSGSNHRSKSENGSKSDNGSSRQASSDSPNQDPKVSRTVNDEIQELTNINIKEETEPTACEDPGICKICLDREYEMVAIPCGHLGVCQDCCNGLWKEGHVLTCPFCNKEDVEFFRVIPQ